MMFVIALALVMAGYLVGSIPTGFWLAKALKGIDIRTIGSGSTGATNVWRTVGAPAGIAVFVIDFLKGYLPVSAALLMGGNPEFAAFDRSTVVPPLVALTALIGHSRSIFLNWQGGKSAATGLGTIVALQPLVGLAVFLSWCVLLWFSRIVSLASIFAVFVCAIYMGFAHVPGSFLIYTWLSFVYITYRHKSNIGRMISGTEPKLGDKPKELVPTSGAGEPKTESSTGKD